MFVWQLLDNLVGTLAPHSCISCRREGSLLCTECGQNLPPLNNQCFRCHTSLTFNQAQAMCTECLTRSPLINVWSRTAYDGLALQLVHAIKFGRAQSGAVSVAEQMAHVEYNIPAETVIVPVPTSASRQRQRGYDQAKLIAKYLARITGRQYKDMLVRVGSTRQVGAGRRDRLRQIDNAFFVRTTKLPLHLPLLLVDDVLTTGATVEVATRTLNKFGFRQVYAATFAVTY